MIMRHTILVLAALTLIATEVPARTVAAGRFAAGNARGAQAAVQTPNKPSAPLAGVLGGVSIANKAVSINGQSFRMNEPLVAVLDKRPDSNGLVELSDLRPGMKVRYRAQREADGVERVVELWIIANAPAPGERASSGRKL
jgi:hypothetical protein